MSVTRILALATCHNRRDATLGALEALYAQELPQGTVLDIHLVDDGSTDGTALAIASRFPEVHVHTGTGELFWAGGMRFGWHRAWDTALHDALLVFNDDVQICADAVRVLLRTSEELYRTGAARHAVTGAFEDPVSGGVAYGGVVRSSDWHPLRFRQIPPTERMQDCTTLNMNLALLSAEAVDDLGFLSSEFTHCKADFDFGLRLRSAGGRVVLAPGFVGSCSRNPASGTSSELGIGFTERWRRLTGVKEHPPRERAIYFRRHAGRLWPIYWLLPYARILAEGLLVSIRGNGSPHH